MLIHPYIQQKYFLILCKYRNGRQNASSFRASIVTADKVCDAMGWSTTAAVIVQDAARWSTPTADRVPSTCAEILSRPSEYFRNLRKQHNGRQSMRCNRKEYYSGRQSTRCDRIEYSNGLQSSCYEGRSTLMAVGVSKTNSLGSYQQKIKKFNLFKI